MKLWVAVDLVGGEKESPDFKTNKFLLVQPISPESGAPFTLTVSSDGPGASQTESIGVYEKLIILKNSRPAWQHIDNGYYISHNGERWYVTDDLYDTEGYRFLRSAITSETMPPSSDWEYRDGTDWSSNDRTLTVKGNSTFARPEITRWTIFRVKLNSNVTLK